MQRILKLLSPIAIASLPVSHVFPGSPSVSNPDAGKHTLMKSITCTSEVMFAFTIRLDLSAMAYDTATLPASPPES